MINLMPDEYKREIRAGRTNVLLVRYISILVVAVITLGGLLVGAYLVLNTTKQIAESKVAENQLRVAEYQQVKSEADSLRRDLATAKTILDNDVSFTKLIYKIADIVPANVVLEDLNLDPKNFGSSATMTANAKTFEDATKLKDAFISNSQIFTDVQLQNIRSDSTANDKYPVEVKLTVVINKGALR